jgi:hypothetical protein
VNSRSGRKSLFATDEEQVRVVRQLRLLRDDVAELSELVGILIALSRRGSDHELIKALNQNSSFWNGVLGALSTSVFVCIGRIHDTRKEAYFRKIIEFAKTRNALSQNAKQFEQLTKAHDVLIGKVLRLRNAIFAHTSFNAPEHIAFGFEGLTWDQVEAYWRDLAQAAKALETSIFGARYDPATNIDMLNEDIGRANEVLDRMRELAVMEPSSTDLEVTRKRLQ